MKQDLLKQFANPPAMYRGKPFWAWNGRLEENELRRQIRILRRMGLGGFFMHSRLGLATPYLSREWFALVAACADEARKVGMEAWLYDEDRWPSGAAGGLVTKNPQYRHRYLVMERFHNPRRFKWTPQTLAAFTARIKGVAATDIRRLARGRKPARLMPDEEILEFHQEVSPGSPWYNGQTYLDTLSHAAVRKFIEITHEAYRKHVGAHFNREIPGIFTDEPNFGGMFGDQKAVPWTDKLPAAFKSRYGYDLLDRLPEIYFDAEGRSVSQARWHYHDCITFLFTDAFARQIGAWCARHKIAHTGHVLAEETLSSQTHVVGSCMRFYEYMQAPGMDILTEYRREYDTAKQVSSAARQFGRKWRLTEIYGCTGWDFTFAGHKAVGDWQVALGINLRGQHLSWYTMEGQAKRDYPAGIFYQSPWWELYPKVEDYFARVHAVMTRGTEARDLLVIHPIESMWTMCRLGWTRDRRIRKYDAMLMALRDSLLKEHLDFDYGDEDILARHGVIAGARGAPVLKVAQAAYRAVIVPPLLTIRKSTLDLLRRFRAASGRVVFAGDVADYVDALPSRGAADLAAQCFRAPAAGKALADSVAETCRRVSIADGQGREIPSALYLLREDKDNFYLFVCNTGHKPGQLKPQLLDIMARDRRAAFEDVRIRGFAGCAGAPVEFDPETGARFAAVARQLPGAGWEIRTSLPALGSRLFVAPRRKTAERLAPRPQWKTVRETRIGGKEWNIVLSECNNVALDWPRYRIGNGPWRQPDEVLRVDGAVRDALGVPRRGGSMVQPWAREVNPNPKSLRVQLAYAFEVRELPRGDLCLALEQPQTFRIAVNGVKIDTDAEAGWWVDRSLRKVPFDPVLLRLGRNEITLDCDYTADHPGLECVYLLGSFGARVHGQEIVITAQPAQLRLGDWVGQGLPFYSGSVSYCRVIRPGLRRSERLFVRVPAYRGAAVRVMVDGRTAGIVAWEPNEVDITACLPGDGRPAELRLEVLGHRRNSHGPLHLAKKWPEWTGPGQFITRGRDWQDRYQLVPCGLMAPPRLAVRILSIRNGYKKQYKNFSGINT